MIEVNNCIEDKVLSIIQEITGMKTEQLSGKLDSCIGSDLGIDSLDRISIINSLEDAFRITIPDESVKNLNTISSLIEYAQEHKRF